VRNNQGALLYTRGGNLQVDKHGNLLTPTNERLQGWTSIAGVVDTNTAIGDITVPVGTLKAPNATDSFSFDLNLDASATAGPPPTEFSTSIEVFDSLGQSHIVTVTFTKTDTERQWNYEIAFPDADVTTPVTPATGTLTFDDQGKVTAPTATDTIDPLVVTGLRNGAGELTLNWHLYDGLTPRITQFAQPSSVSANAQDGSPAAQLIRVGLDDGGKLLAQYSDGQQIYVGQLAMAAIRNPESLVAAGNNTYMLSARSALPAIGLADTGGRGTIIGGSIEFANVDIATEFTSLIVLQRGFQANTRIVTTVDELSQETINLKR
jgi:flagellar hook protein FlgE